MNFQTFSQVAFAFQVTPELLGMGLRYALAMGLIGGLLPAIRAARLPIPSALRETLSLWSSLLRASLGARVCPAVHLEQLRRVHMGIPLRRRELDVTEQLLDRTQVGASLQQVAGKGMPQRVRTDPEACAAARHVSRHQPLHTPTRQPPSVRIQKKRICLWALGFGFWVLSSPGGAKRRPV